MQLQRSLALVAAVLTIPGVYSAQYCYCTTKAGFMASGIEEQCPKSLRDWSPIDCIIGTSSNICKHPGSEVTPEKMKELQGWCDKQIAIDSKNVTYTGGTITCSSDLPADAEDVPCEDAMDVTTNMTRRFTLSKLRRRQSSDDNDSVDNGSSGKGVEIEKTPEYLSYRPSGNNLVTTNEIVHWDNDWARMIQINELRLEKYEWVLIKSYNNRGSAEPHSEEIKITEGIHKLQNSRTKVGVEVNFEVSFPYVSAGVKASASQEWFQEQKSDSLIEKKAPFKVKPGSAVYIYQLVYTWNTEAWFRWEAYRTEATENWRINGKHPEGDWTVSTKRSNKPLTANSRAEIRTDQFVATSVAIHGKGTFDVDRDYDVVEPAYPRTNLRKIGDMGDLEKDVFSKLGFKNEV